MDDRSIFPPPGIIFIPPLQIWVSRRKRLPRTASGPCHWVQDANFSEYPNTVPEETLQAVADHGEVRRTMPRDGRDAEHVLVSIARAGIDVQGIDVAALSRQLQDDGTRSFAAFWKDLPGAIAARSKALRQSS
jgi:transaldolase